MSLYYREDTCFDVTVYRKEIGERSQAHGNSSVKTITLFRTEQHRPLKGNRRILRPGL